jgi:hypothetical protein
LYVRQTEFLEPDQAAAEWNSGKLDGLVVPDDELTELLPRLPGAVRQNRNVRAGRAVPKALHLSGALLIGRNLRLAQKPLDFAALICRLACD